jgi:hypothetical protein
VRWNSEVFTLPDHHLLQAALANGKTLLLEHEKTIQHESGNRTWVGKVKGAGEKSRVVLTVSDGVPVGTINTPDGVIYLRDQANHSVVLDSSEEPGTAAGFHDDMRVPPVVEGVAAPARNLPIAMRSAGRTVVDVMVLYDSEMAGLTGSIDAKIDNLIATSNTAYADSGINVELRLVHKEQVSYANSLSNGTALDALTYNEGVFSGLETERTDLGADLVAMLRAFDSSAHGGCGVAWVGGAGGSSISPRYGYSVVSYGTDPPNPQPGQGYYFCSDYSFAHELGHNMGSAHDRANSSVAGHYGYSYGFGIDGTFGTIMSYLNPEVGLFSSPSLTCTANGDPCGIDENATNSANNALSISNTRGVIAAFRDEVLPITGPVDQDKIGFWRPSDKRFYLDANGNGTWDNGDTRTAAFGIETDLPLTGDWNGDGFDEIGVRRPGTRRFYLDINGSNNWDAADVATEFFGWKNDIPVAGDWNGDGKDELGLRRPSTKRFYLDMNGNNVWDAGDIESDDFGWRKDIPITGDWNGDGKDEIGLRRPGTKRFYLDVNGSNSWDSGDIITEPFGWPADIPVVGDWNDDGVDEIGIWRPGTQQFLLDMNGSNSWDNGDLQTEAFGSESDTPLSGNW